jgi:hypothetical protein
MPTLYRNHPVITPSPKALLPLEGSGELNHDPSAGLFRGSVNYPDGSSATALVVDNCLVRPSHGLGMQNFGQITLSQPKGKGFPLALVRAVNFLYLGTTTFARTMSELIRNAVSKAIPHTLSIQGTVEFKGLGAFVLGRSGHVTYQENSVFLLAKDPVTPWHKRAQANLDTPRVHLGYDWQEKNGYAQGMADASMMSQLQIAIFGLSLVYSVYKYIAHLGEKPQTKRHIGLRLLRPEEVAHPPQRTSAELTAAFSQALASRSAEDLPLPTPSLSPLPMPTTRESLTPYRSSALFVSNATVPTTVPTLDPSVRNALPAYHAILNARTGPLPRPIPYPPSHHRTPTNHRPLMVPVRYRG